MVFSQLFSQKRFIIDVLQCPKYASALNSQQISWVLFQRDIVLTLKRVPLVGHIWTAFSNAKFLLLWI